MFCCFPGCTDDIVTSDHSPVFATFEVGVTSQFVSKKGTSGLIFLCSLCVFSLAVNSSHSWSESLSQAADSLHDLAIMANFPNKVGAVHVLRTK